MKPGQLAKTLGVSRGTIFNWRQWYAEFLSPEPPEGDDRVFTDEDIRVIAFIKTLTDKRINTEGIKLALKQRQESGTPFPPVPPEMLSDDKSSADPGTALALREKETQLALKEAELSEANARIEELRRQLIENQARDEQEKAQLRAMIETERERYEGLVDKYLKAQAQSNYEKGMLEAQLQELKKAKGNE